MKHIVLVLMFLSWTLLSCQEQFKLPEGFGYVKEEIPNIHVELRYLGVDNFLGRPVDGYHKDVAVLSSKAIEALKLVQGELEQYNLSIKIFDSYRPQQAVDHFVRWAKKLNDTVTKAKFYPEVKKAHLFKEGYIASRSGHTRGSTLDITLVDMVSGKELDMGSAWDFFGKESWVENKKLSAQQLANRMLLQTIMRKHGFKHYPKEWWHFTLANEPFPNTYFNFPVE